MSRKKIEKFEEKGITVFHGDCMDVLPELREESVHFVVCDPPYDCSKSLITRKNAKDLDSNFGEWDKFFTDWVNEAYRVLVPDSGMVVFVPATRFETLMHYCEAAGFEYVQPWFWKKTSPPVAIRRGLQWSVEHMIYVVKGKHKLRIENKGRCHNWFAYASPKGKVRFHKTQKPVGLLMDIVRYVSDEGQTILDCFHGSGSTGEAALGLGRSYVGIERDDEYFRKSVNRLRSGFVNNIV